MVPAGGGVPPAAKVERTIGGSEAETGSGVG